MNWMRSLGQLFGLVLSVTIIMAVIVGLLSLIKFGLIYLLGGVL